MKFKSDIEVQAGLKDSSGAAGTSGQVLSSNGTTVSWVNPGGGVASDVQNLVKAGVAINKGQAVYVTSADGTNIIVGLASNTAEATSSKTLGLLDATVAINGMANVVQVGRLEGLDTSTAIIGDPVWLGTNGNLIYGLANKPYAPAHLVYIGVVTRVNANNGEIFISVQNGFELNEIHDVDLKTTVPTNGDILGYNGSLWVNKTIPGWLGYTPQAALNGTGFVKISGTTISYDNSTYLTSAVTTFSGGTTGLTPNTATSGAVTLAGTLVLANGGTGSTTAAGARTNLGATTLGANIFTSANPGAIRFLRANADNTASWLDAATFRTAIGAGTGSGTVTSVAALTIGTTGTDVTSTVATGTTTPVITLNLPTASAVSRGVLNNTDWTTFNSKQNALNGTGFVKVTGTTVSYDNSTYALDNAVVKLTGDQGISGQKSFNLVQTGYNLTLRTSDIFNDGFIESNNGMLRLINNTTGNDLFRLESTGVLFGQGFKKSGGLSSQFLKADGTVDSTVYVPATRTITINGVTQNLSANQTWTIASGVTSFNTRTGAITLTSGDVTTALGYTPVTNARTLTINGVGYDLSANRSWTVTAVETDTLATVTARGNTTGDKILSTYNSSSGIANNSFNTAKTVLGNIQMNNGGGVSGNNNQAAITFQGGSINEAQAGIYVSNNSSTGTAMGFATTDSYTTGPQLFLYGLNDGTTIFPRSYSQSNGSFRAPIFYDSNDTTYYGDFNSTTRQYQAISFGDNTRYSAISTTINGAGAGDKLILYGGASNYDARLLVGADYDMLLKSQGNSAGKGSFKFYTGQNCNLAMTIDGNQYTSLSGGLSVAGNSSWFGGYGGGSGPGLAFENQNTFARIVFWGLDFYDWNNGTQMVINDGYVLANNSMRSPIFYDSNNTGYYIDPASTSNIVGLQVNGTLNVAASNAQFWTTTGGGYQRVDARDDSTGARMHWYGVLNNGATSNFRHAWYDGTAYFGVTADSAFINFTRSGGGNITTDGSFRSPIFYDSNNTGYYIDPTGTSAIDTLVTRGASITSAAHSTSYKQIELPAGNNGAATGIVTMRTWCSEPNVSWDWAGFGYNVYNDGGTPSGFGRANTSFGQAYMRMAPDGNWYFYNTNTGGTRYQTMHLTNGGNANFGNNIVAAGDVTAFSDRRIKENIQTINDALDKVLSLRGVTYNRSDVEDKSEKIGVIAQEVQEILPQVVHEQEDGMLGVSYGNITAVLIEAIKEQQKQIEELKELVNKLINKQ